MYFSTPSSIWRNIWTTNRGIPLQCKRYKSLFFLNTGLFKPIFGMKLDIGKIQLNIRNPFSQLGQLYTGRGCPERLCMFCPWRISRCDWTKPWLFPIGPHSKPWFDQKLGIKMSWVSSKPNYSTILWFDCLHWSYYTSTGSVALWF